MQFTDLWGSLAKKLHKGELDSVVVMMRGVWLRINYFLFEKNFASLGAIFEQAEAFLEEFQLAQGFVKRGIVSSAAGRRGGK